MIIERYNNSIMFDNGKVKSVYPMNSILLISNDNSEAISVRLKASRKNVLTFNYKDVTNLTASSANEMMEQISLLSNSSGNGGGVTEEDTALIDEINNIIG